MSELSERVGEIVKQAILAEWNNGLSDLVKKELGDYSLYLLSPKSFWDRNALDKVMRTVSEKVLTECALQQAETVFKPFYEVIARDETAKKVRKSLKARGLPVPSDVHESIKNYFVDKE